MKYLLTLAAFCASSAALADMNLDDTIRSPWQIGAGIGLTAGGDDMGKIKVYDKATGKVVNNENVRAGRLFQVDFGTRYRFSKLPVSVQATLGYHFDTVQGDDPLVADKKVSFQFYRYPLEIIPAYHFDKHAVGLGLRYDFNTTFEFTDRFKHKFKNAPGLVLQYEYEATDNISLGLRYTAIKYKWKEDTSQSVKGNHVGMNAHVWF
nr:outer membrane beta-barrel protein [Chitinivorax sp. B]